MTKDVSAYVGKDIIARLALFNNNPEDTQCLVYPLFAKTGNHWGLIKTSDFGSYKNIRVSLVNRQEAGDFIDEMGEIVSIHINGKKLQTATNHLELQIDNKGNDYCYMGYHPKYGERGSQIWIEPFKDRTSFYQIVPCNMQFDNLKQTHRVMSDTKIFTSKILIECVDNEYKYGPFNYFEEDGEITVSSDDINDNFIKAYDVDVTYDIPDDHNRGILYSLVFKDDLDKSSVQQKIDWLTDDEMFEYFANVLRKCQYSDDQIELVRKLGAEQVSSHALERCVRLNNMLDKFIEDKKCVNSLFQAVLNNEDMLQQFLTKVPHDDAFFKDNIYTEQMNRKNEALETTKAELLLKNAELLSEKSSLAETNQNLLEKISDLRQQNTKLQDEKSKTEKVIIHDAETEAKIKKLSEDNKKLSEKLKLQGEYDDILKQKENIVSEYEDYKSKLDQVQRAIGETVEDLSNETNIIAQHVNAELLQNVLNKISENNNETTKLFNEDLLEDASAEDIIDRVQKYLNDSGREIARNDVINYLACIIQGFITTFAGEPGTGKTSLCGLIGRALGLVRDDESNRMAEVSVERGWTSVKDFIGYYNPLTRRMEKSNIEMFNVLNTLDTERCTEKPAPYFVLLDEANLSPIEHYWANFLRFCDEDSGTTRTLNLGGQHNYYVPAHLRFLTTVNFDHTTEALSPRFLDRSWIITLRAEENIKPTKLLQPNNTVVSYNSLFNAFNNKNGSREENDTYLRSNKKWEQIREIFNDNHFSVMPRNQKMVETYIRTASQYMQSSNKYVAVDYAVAQKILPLINGMGNDYQKLIEKLLNECDDMPLTNYHLQRIKRNADNNMGYYQFFAR